MPRMKDRKLIVNADDFGLTEGVNNAIIECFKSSSVSSTTLMANMNGTQNAIKLAKENPQLDLDVGLHFNLTLGKSLSDPNLISSLVNSDGFFHKRVAFEKKSTLGLINKNHVEIEFQSQLQKYHDSGLPITHVDGHQHIQLYSPVFPVLSKYCIENRIPLRIPFVNYIGKMQIFDTKSLKKLARSNLLRLLIYINRLFFVGNKNLISNNHFYSIFDYIPIPNQIKRENYLEILDNLKEGISELMVHPAIVDEELAGLTDITKISQQEYDILASSSLKDECQKRGIEFINYGNLS